MTPQQFYDIGIKDTNVILRKNTMTLMKTNFLKMINGLYINSSNISDEIIDSSLQKIKIKE